MSFVTWKLEHTAYDSDTKSYAESPTVLVDYFNPILNMKIGDGKDSFKLDITNESEEYNNVFNPNDRLVISRTINSSSTASSDILMSGAIRDVPEEITSSKNSIKLDGYNYSETVMGAIIPVLDVQNKDVPSAIQEALTWASTHNLNFAVTWSSNNPTSKYSDSGEKNAGDSFPNVGKIYYYKTLQHILEELSKENFTENGNYYWLVNDSNELIWDKRTEDITYTFDDTTSRYTRLKITKDIKDVKNYIIMKGGIDAKGSPISYPVPDYSSIGKHGFKFLIYISSTTNARDIVDADAKSSTIGGESVADIEDFFSGGGSYSPPWSSSTFTTFNDYNDALRAYIKTELNKEGFGILKTKAYGTLSVIVDRSPLDGFWELGSVVSCNITNLDESPKLMRVEQVQYTSTSDTYTLKEDKGTI